VHERKRQYLVTIGVVALVIAASIIAIWQLHSRAVSRIDEVIVASVENNGGSSVEELGEAARVDPVGFSLANYMHANYGTIVLVVYYLLGALGIAALARFVIFLISSFDRRRFYPDDASLREFLDARPGTWNDFSEEVMAQNHLKSRFWRILRDSVMVTESSGRYDHLYLHLRNRIDRITESLNETALYESVATASPAAGFFGTLVGLLYIFSSSEAGIAGLSESPTFSVGMKVAIITSLWGLFNMGLAIICGYITRRIVGRIHEQMVVRGVIVCEVAEAIYTPEDILEPVKNAVEDTLEPEGNAAKDILEPEKSAAKETVGV
jgi:biopolymer transport protein ExbB/TolQ